MLLYKYVNVYITIYIYILVCVCRIIWTSAFDALQDASDDQWENLSMKIIPTIILQLNIGSVPKYVE